MTVLDWLQQLLGSGRDADSPPPLPQEVRNLLYQGSVGPEGDVVYAPDRQRFLQRGREDMGIVATPRLPAENIDELLRARPPEMFDSRMLYSRRDLENAQFNFAPGYLQKTSGSQPSGLLQQILAGYRQ